MRWVGPCNDFVSWLLYIADGAHEMTFTHSLDLLFIKRFNQLLCLKMEGVSGLLLFVLTALVIPFRGGEWKSI